MDTLRDTVALQQALQLEFLRNLRPAIRRAKQAQHARQLATSSRIMNGGR